jgi:hypothetical protein
MFALTANQRMVEAHSLTRRLFAIVGVAALGIVWLDGATTAAARFARRLSHATHGTELLSYL